MGGGKPPVSEDLCINGLWKEEAMNILSFDEFVSSTS